MSSRCATIDGVLRKPCDPLVEIASTKAIELRFVRRAGARRPVASYLLLRRKFIVFWCPCCGERIGHSDGWGDDDGTVSSTYQQMCIYHPDALRADTSSEQDGAKP